MQKAMLSKIPTWLLLLLPAVCLGLAWPPIGFFPLLFVGLIPLFELNQRLASLRFWRYSLMMYGSVLLWNLILTWWVWNSTPSGAVTMLVANSLLMTLPWLLTRFIGKKMGFAKAEVAFIMLWLAFEFLHHRWDLSWPWLTLGNGFASATWLVQWYDVTGTLGGSAWVLVVNLLLFRALRTNLWKPAIIAFSCIGLGVVLSWLSYATVSTSRHDSLEVVAMQPSFDPWTEKFTRDPSDMVREMLRISRTALDSQSRLLVWPETALVDNIETQTAANDYQVAQLQQLLLQYPQLSILTGADMQRIYYNCKKRPNGTARPTSSPSIWWDSYNSALYLQLQHSPRYYHKSKLVPGTEQMPLTNWFPAINDLAVSLDENSMTGSLGKSDSVILFGKGKAIPAICYESIYGDHLASFARQGAGLIAIITNDAWWGKTPGYLQHLSYAKLRAIEQRKWVVRSANTGTSCFIDPWGKVHQPTEWYAKTAIKQKVELRFENTWYVRLGDVPVLQTLLAALLLWFLRSRETAL